MARFFGFVFGLFLLINLGYSSESKTYTVATVELMKNGGFINYDKVIQQLGLTNVDMLVISPMKGKYNYDSNQVCGSNHDEIIKTLSQSARQANIYIAASLPELVMCDNKYVTVDTGIVFDRNGGIVASSIKFEEESKCNTTLNEKPSFTTDFNVTFSIVYPEDIVMNDVSSNNVVMFGEWVSKMPFMIESHYLLSWSEITGANVVTNSGVFGGKILNKYTLNNAKIIVVQLLKSPVKGYKSDITSIKHQENLIHEDLNDYTLKPVSMDAAITGYTDTVCHTGFCCQFYVKALAGESQPDYSLAVFNGIKKMSERKYIGVQDCAVLACSGLYKRSCVVGLNNSSVVFDKITITSNFSSENSIQYPTTLTPDLQSLSKTTTLDVNTVKNINIVTVYLEKPSTVLSFGIHGRNYGKDFDTITVSENKMYFYDYIFNEDLSNVFDYLWIRLRVLVFIVSIYVLEMM